MTARKTRAAIDKNRKAVEFAKPQQFADFLVGLTENPEKSVSQLCKEVGIPQRTGVEIERRLHAKYAPLLAGVKKATTKSLVNDLEEALPLAMARLKDEDLINKSSYKELVVGVGVMIDKRQLLLGEPTQILNFEERRTMNELAPAFAAEIAKRALPVIEVPYEDVTPIDVRDHSRTARKQSKREDRGRV